MIISLLLFHVVLLLALRCLFSIAVLPAKSPFISRSCSSSCFSSSCFSCFSSSSSSSSSSVWAMTSRCLLCCFAWSC